MYSFLLLLCAMLVYKVSLIFVKILTKGTVFVYKKNWLIGVCALQSLFMHLLDIGIPIISYNSVNEFPSFMPGIRLNI